MKVYIKFNLLLDILKTQSDEEDTNPLHVDQSKIAIKSEFNKPEDYFPYTFHIPRRMETRDDFTSKLFYVLDEATSDLGFRNFCNYNFWLAFFFFLLGTWIRAFLHSFGSWAFLMLVHIEISTFVVHL